MVLGVPLVPFLLVAGGGFLAGMYLLVLVSAVGMAVSGVVIVLVLFWMRGLTRRDDQRLRQVFLVLRLMVVCRNRAFWRCRSYSPFVIRGVRDGWQR
jgi:type IV secretory pathway VirB3-like protein